ncbi:MAG: hypothetical protein PVH17_12790, partial [Anaerolineae bacterium]
MSILRKLLHMSMAGIPAAGWWIEPWVALALAGLFLAASLVVEAGRRWGPWVNRLLWRLLPSVFRASEGDHVLGSTWFAIGGLPTLVLFGQDVGGTAVLFLSWGDPAAELVGRWRGGAEEAKTVVGSVGCLAACLVAAGVGVGLGGL